MNPKDKKGLKIPVHSPSDVAKDAIQTIELEASGSQLGLLTRFRSLNIAMGKYFRFGTVNLVAALSGAGKSIFLQTLYTDFLNRELNIGYAGRKVAIVHFGFEMQAKREIIRMASSQIGVAYSKIMSSYYDVEKKTFVPADAELIEVVRRQLIQIGKQPIFFAASTGNIMEIEETIEHCKKQLPDYDFVIGLDHTTLVEKLDEDSENELLINLAKLGISRSVNHNDMVIFLSQFNSDIEDLKRRDPRNPHLHYPIRSDIYGSRSIYNACDNVITLHRPERLHIKQYGQSKVPTRGVIHGLLLKSRDGDIGEMWFKDDLVEHGQLLLTPLSDLLPKKVN